MVTRTKDGLYEFRFFCPRARQVSIVGDFNGWDRTRMPMNRQSNGEWVAKVRLPEGAYQFKYYADGEWYVDYAAAIRSWLRKTGSTPRFQSADKGV